MALVRLKLGIFLQDIAIRFRVSPSTVSEMTRCHVASSIVLDILTCSLNLSTQYASCVQATLSELSLHY